MKQLITTAVLLFSITTFAQVGINNTSPKATLDITPKTTDGSKPEGLLIPQLDGNSLKTAAYGTAQKGVIVYAKSAASPTDTKTVNVTTEGYYYFDGSAWQKMNGAASGDTTNDAWINDTTNGMVKLGTKADGTARAAGTDFVSKDNGQIGIGTSSPDASAVLDITATNKGLLIPRVALTSTTDQTTISNPATGLMIYNTATAGTAPYDVTPNLMVNNGTPTSPSWTKVVSQNTVTGTGVIGSWSGSNTGNNYTGTITSVEDGISFRSTLAGGGIAYIDYASVTSGTNLISTAGSEESNGGWYWKGKDTTTVGTSFTAITQGSGTVMGSGRRTITVVNLTNGYIYRITLMIDSSNNRAFYFVEKVK
ncbi:hypothetical protein [Chryseobacterium lineare]